MQGMTMIPNEEYKDLILAEADAHKMLIELENVKQELLETDCKVANLQNELNCLLRTLTGGQEVVKWEDGKFETYDLADRQAIVDYINENYVANGKLRLKGE